MLNLDSRSKSKLLWVGTLLVPALAVQGVRFFIGGTASSASAATAPAPIDTTPVVAAPETAKPLAPEQARAVAWILSRSQTLNARSPMDRPDTISESAMQHDAAPDAPAPAPAARAPGGMTITAIMASGAQGGSIVSINHKLYRMGDEIVPRWKLTAIDTRNRTATIDGPEGQSITLTLMIAEK